MNKITLLAVLSCVLAWFGCEPALADGSPDVDTSQPVACDTNPCPVHVDRETWLKQCLLNCQPTVTDVIVVDRHNTTGTIVWSLPADSSFNFAEDGIEFRKRSGFRDCGPGDKGKASMNAGKNEGPGTKTWQCTNNGEPGAYKYRVHIRFGLLSFSVDPWVVNK